MIVTTNNGNDQNNFIDVGINGSGYSDSTFSITGALDGYLYVDGGNLAIGTSKANDIKLFTGGTLAANEKARIVNATGNLLVGTTTDNTIDKIQIAKTASVNFPMEESFDDFLWTNFGNGSNPYSVVSVTANGGLGSIEGDATGNDYLGLLIAATGTTNNNTGHSAIDFFNSANKIRIGNKRIFFKSRVRVPVLSSASVGYKIIIGLQDGNVAGLPTNGIFFSYNHTENSGRWIASCRRASTSSSINSSITVLAQWYVLECEINAAGDSVEFFVNRTSIGSLTTNIPLTSTSMRPVIQIDKTTTTTTSSILHVDNAYWKMFR